MVNKLIKDMDDKTWREFTGLCKMKGVTVGVELTKILQIYVQKELEKRGK